MAALNENLTIVRGDTKKWTITIARNGVAVDLTGAYIWFTAKNSVKDEDDKSLIALVSKVPNMQGSIVVSSPATLGIATMTINPAATDFITPPVNLQYDVQLEEADGTLTTVAVGYLQVTPDVTRRRTYFNTTVLATTNKAALNH
jgi:hypothetical protein